jgi:hypothetical protein
MACRRLCVAPPAPAIDEARIQHSRAVKPTLAAIGATMENLQETAAPTSRDSVVVEHWPLLHTWAH